MNKIILLFGLVTSMFLLAGCSTEYTVEFETNGGSLVNSQTVEEGSTIQVPTTNREFYTLEGWYTSVNGGQTLDERWSFTNNSVQSDITLYANWIPKEYTITFNTDGGSVVDPITQAYDTVITTPEAPIKEGHTFTGWSEVPSLMPAKDITLTALWEKNSYSVNYIDSDGSIIKTFEFDYLDPIEGIHVDHPKKEGFIFADWSSELPDMMPAQNIEIKAIYIDRVYEYRINEGEVRITNYIGSSTEVTIPNIIEEYFVTSIDDSAFDNKRLKSVTIPDSVTSIGDSVFRDNQLPSIVIPDSVKIIGDYAFTNNQLTSVTIPDSVTIIGDFAFFGNQLTSITIPDSVTSIGMSVFTNNQLTNVTIPDSLTSLGRNAFSGNQLTSIEIPGRVKIIGDFAFTANQLTSVTISDSVTSIGTASFSNNQLTTVTIPDSVTSIGTFSFSNNQLTSVSISGKITTIEMRAFSENQLTSITIPDSVTSIGSAAFLENQLTTVTIPDSVTSIGTASFSNNPLISVTIEGDETRFNDVWEEIGFPENLKPGS